MTRDIGAIKCKGVNTCEFLHTHGSFPIFSMKALQDIVWHKHHAISEKVKSITCRVRPYVSEPFSSSIQSGLNYKFGLNMLGRRE